jgi:uridylate kinase
MLHSDETKMPTLKYPRILLKLSGESLGHEGSGVDLHPLKNIAQDVSEIQKLGAQVGIVVGAGNFIRGEVLEEQGLDRETSDYMGMLGTVINSLALAASFAQMGLPVVLMSLLPVVGLIDAYDIEKALRALEAGSIVIFAAGTGKPFCTTDTAASQRAIEIHADLLLKATKVDGVYSADPKKDPQATLYSHITYEEVLAKKLAVMDEYAIQLCQQAKLPLRVFNMNHPSALKRIVLGENEGTLVGENLGDKI